ncbi:Hypothetical_protein [Hexamita inflata]|uniref:Hypothetical_protein n=1 Tax=Hexamita inflata TaxID=28002 RepID=A0AA86Q002_9EUKA|nr:Hypothetical protein HINF_LOCUS31582 [Hexamita inflata]
MFPVIENNEYLVISSDCTVLIDIQQIYPIYSSITFIGKQYEDFKYFELLNRSQYINITDSTVDLSHIMGSWQSLSLLRCKCVGELHSYCEIDNMELQYTSFQTSQVKQCKVKELQVSMDNSNEFDLYNFYQLDCVFKSLVLTNIQVDLSRWAGKYSYVFLNGCSFHGNASSALQINKIDLIQCNLTGISLFDDLQCNILSVHQTTNNNTFSLQHSNKINLVQAYLENYICDITDSGKWRLHLTNCGISGKSTPILDLDIILIFDEKMKHPIRFPHLLGNTCRIKFSQQQIKLSTIYTLNPDQIVFSNCVVFFDSSNGFVWNKIAFQNCDLINARSLNARDIVFQGQNGDFSEFVAQNVNVIQSVINQLPKCQNLKINGSKVSFNTFQFKKVIITDSKIKNLQISKFQQIEYIQLNGFDPYIKKEIKVYLKRKKCFAKKQIKQYSKIIQINKIMEQKNVVILKLMTGMARINAQLQFLGPGYE